MTEVWAWSVCVLTSDLMRNDRLGAGMDFVSFSLNYWEDLWQSRHQIMLALARSHKVLFVSPPFPVREVLEDLRRKHLPKTGLVHRQDNLYTLVFPKWLFVTYRFPRIANWMASLRRRIVKRSLRKLNLRDVVVIIWHPHFIEFVGACDEVLCCYYVDDEFAGYPEEGETERQRIIKQEDELLKRADLVFANGPALLQAKNHYGNAICVPMTADFELFSRSRLAETTVPGDLDAVPHPRIGYIGNVNDKVDFQLLLELSTKSPDWSFVLVGPVNVRIEECAGNLSRLKSRPNVYLLGPKPRTSLPNYVKGLDVCLLCYRPVGWAYYVYPLKLHKYLASGKPIVGTALRSLREFSDVVQIANTVEEWYDAIRLAIQDKDQALVEKRIRTAYENRLESRIAAIEKAVQDKLQEKRIQPVLRGDHQQR